MINEDQHIEALKNAVRDPVSALTAVEVDTKHRADRLVKILQQEINNRPGAVLLLLCNQPPGLLLEQAEKEILEWAGHEGVLFIIDQGCGDEKQAHDFWTKMNFLREGWGGLKCHVIFFLLPLNYRSMVRDADHFADWIPLKLHILGISEDNQADPSYQIKDTAFSENEMSFKTARQVLSSLQEQLAQAVHNGADKSLLVQRYYLPMFEAAVKIYALQRAQSLRRHISETDIKETEMPEWLYNNFILDLELRNFDDAERSITRLLEWAKENNDQELEADSYHNMGTIAQEQRDFTSAEKWYRKSLEINEKHGNEHGAAGTYHQIGNLSGLQENYEEAGKWLIKAVIIFIRFNDLHNAKQGANNFMIFYKQSPPETQTRLKAMWEEAGLPAFV